MYENEKIYLSGTDAVLLLERMLPYETFYKTIALAFSSGNAERIEEGVRQELRVLCDWVCHLKGYDMFAQDAIYRRLNNVLLAGEVLAERFRFAASARVLKALIGACIHMVRNSTQMDGEVESIFDAIGEHLKTWRSENFHAQEIQDINKILFDPIFLSDIDGEDLLGQLLLLKKRMEATSS
jgi:hypothetical protein